MWGHSRVLGSGPMRWILTTSGGVVQGLTFFIQTHMLGSGGEGLDGKVRKRAKAVVKLLDRMAVRAALEPEGFGEMGDAEEVEEEAY
jgi:hypothetical protein